ncbi:hypothetical protein WI23_09775 [Burkholderia oklahomensis C6786]|nr:hypothetical protein WI23_09775 [Burkholderia oklahomensis C6786]KUY54777.1 hypothetical protein WI23_22085 [Burkholderia oklahomensis C6786]
MVGAASAAVESIRLPRLPAGWLPGGTIAFDGADTGRLACIRAFERRRGRRGKRSRRECVARFPSMPGGGEATRPRERVARREVE